MTRSHQEFRKYDAQGAYHWKQMRPTLRRFNAGLAARYQRALSLVSLHCKPENTVSILDIGCGDGYFTSQLAALFPNARVDGYDFSDTGISLARKMSKVNNLIFHVGDAFGNNRADLSLITATDVIEHLDDYQGFLGRCHAALAVKGLLLLSTPIRIKEKPDDPYHVHEFFKEELAAEVSHAGFQLKAHTISHDYKILENYGKRYSFLGIGRMRLGKYRANFDAIVLGRNPFASENGKLPTMQYMIAEKI